MIFECRDLDRALRTPELMPDLRAHAETCPRCASELHLWNEISRLAPELRQEWESPFLWPRIQARLEAEAVPRRAPAAGWRLSLWAACALLAVVALAAVVVRPWRGVSRDLLTENALAEVRQAETAYTKSIARLAAVASREIEQSPSPVAAAYREKLALLDSAIADAAANADRNRYNAYLRAELASLYQEKQKTLQDWLNHENRN